VLSPYRGGREGRQQYGVKYGGWLDSGSCWSPRRKESDGQRCHRLQVTPRSRHSLVASDGALRRCISRSCRSRRFRTRSAAGSETSECRVHTRGRGSSIRKPTCERTPQHLKRLRRESVLQHTSRISGRTRAYYRCDDSSSCRSEGPLAPDHRLPVTARQAFTPAQVEEEAQ
jgi:hypothetical protein